MFSGRGLVSGRQVGERQQLVDALDRMACDDLGEHVAQIGLRIDAVYLAGFDERGDDRPVLATAVGAGEEVVLAAERDRTNRTLDNVGVDLDAPVVEEAGKAVPARERVADGCGDGRLAGDG